jgi:hypothetical protein
VCAVADLADYFQSEGARGNTLEILKTIVQENGVDKGRAIQAFSFLNIVFSTEHT